MRTNLTKKGALLGSTLLAGMAMASGAWAQATTQPTTVGELVVTGSRIPRPNLEQATPVAGSGPCGDAIRVTGRCVLSLGEVRPIIRCLDGPRWRNG